MRQLNAFRAALPRLAAFGAAAVVAGLAAAPSIAQTPPPAPAAAPATPAPAGDLAPLTFSTQQVTAGRSLYNGTCSGCHGQDLQGLDAPALTGDAFTHWTTQPVGELYNYIKAVMPADNPGGLTDVQVAGAVAFILSRNGFTPGEVALPTDPAALLLMGYVQ
ncbi:MAG: c-type cytochrome [Bauldia sp.]